jgi:diacylglycerol kinase family enzyme
VPIAVISNLNSRRNQRLAGQVRALLETHPDVIHIESRDLSELPEHLDALRGSGASHLAINGGDGTAQQTLTAMLNGAWTDPPTLALLPGGTTNMTAHDLNGGKLGLLAALRAFLDAAQRAAPPRHRGIIRVQCEGHDDQYGFCFGLGAIVRGIRYCHERVYRMGLSDQIAPGVAMLRAIYGIARREPVFSEGFPVRLRYDLRHDNDNDDADCASTSADERLNASFMCIATLERLFLGMTPFWGSGSGELAMTIVRENPARLLRTLPALLRGRPNRFLTPDHGYTSRRLDTLQIKSDGEYMLDGEIFPAAENPLALDAVTLPILALATTTNETAR